MYWKSADYLTPLTLWVDPRGAVDEFAGATEVSFTRQPYGCAAAIFFDRVHTMFRSILTLTILVVTSLVASAEQSTEQAPAVNFTDHVLPIFRQHCLKCHNANDAEAGLAIDSFGGLMEGGGSGDVVSAGDPAGSRLYLVMSHDEEPTMPPNQEKLPAESLETIRKWIEGGLLENSGSKAKKRKGPSLAFSSAEGGKPDEIFMPESLWRVPVVTTDRAAAATALAASPWAPLVAVAGQRQVSMYHTDTSELVGIIPYPEGIPQVLQFSRDGAYLLVAGGTHSTQGTASLYDVRSGKRLLKVGDELDIAFGADINDQLSRIALGGPQRIVRIFDTATGEAVFELKKHTDWVYCVDYSPDGVLVASGDRSGGLHVWEADTGRLYLDLIGHQGAIRGLAWRPDSNVLVSASEDGTVKLWEMNAGNQLKSFNAHSGGVTGVAMAKDGRIVTSGKDKTVKLWNADGSAVATMPAFSEPALEVAVTHDGSRIIGGDWNGRTIMWLIADPKQASELIANPPRLEDQRAALHATVAETEKSLAAATAELAQRQRQAEEAKQAQANLVANLEATRKAFEKASQDKSSAESLLAQLQDQLAEVNRRQGVAQARVAELQQQSKDVSAQLTTFRKQVADAVVLRDQAEQRHRSVAQSLASIQLEHDQLKSDAVAAMAELNERELEVSAKEQAAASAQAEADLAQQQSGKSLAEVNSQLTAFSETIKLATQQCATASVEIQAAETAIAAASEKVDAHKKQLDAKVTELASLQKQLSETQDEAQKKLLAERITAVEAERQSAEMSSATAEKQLADLNASKISLENQFQKGKETIATASDETKKLTLKRDALVQSLSTFKEQLERCAKEHKVYSDQLAQVRSEITVALGNKESAVKKMASLIAQKTQLMPKAKQLADTIAREESSRSDSQSKVVDFEALLVDIAGMLSATGTELDSIKEQQSNLANRIKSQPGVIEGLAAQVKKHADATANLETQLLEAKDKIGASDAAIEKASSAVTIATDQLHTAQTRLQGIQSELVAFRSQAEKLQADSAAAQAMVAKRRAAVEPQATLAQSLAESMSARDQKLAEVSEAMKKLQSELNELQKAQSTEQAKLKETQSRLEELERAAEDAEAAADATREMVEFFESAYGA